MRRILRIAVIVAAGFWTSASVADDRELCNGVGGPDVVRIEACTRLVQSGTFRGAELAKIYMRRGFLHERRPRQEGAAFADYTEAIKADPNNANAFNARGNIFSGIQNYDRAIADFNEAIRIAPRNYLIWRNRGLAHRASGDPDKAIADFSESIRLNSKPADSFNWRGEAFVDKRDYRRAIADFNEAILRDPDYEHALNNRAKAHFEIKDYRRALEDYETAFRIAPNLTEARDGAERAKAGVAQRERVALVIGNGAYRHVPRLANTVNDARIMRDTLTKLGFHVIYGEELDKRAMADHIRQFGVLAEFAQVSVAYFAGHGSTFADIPYVVPVDSKYEKLSSIPSELIQVESMVGALRRTKGVRLVILDACRDNERELELRREQLTTPAVGSGSGGGAVASEAASRGVGRLRSADGLIVVYSTQHLTTAEDGVDTTNSPFTRALAKHIVTPGLDIKDALFRTAREVIEETRGTQRPEIAISLFDPYVLAK